MCDRLRQQAGSFLSLSFTHWLLVCLTGLSHTSQASFLRNCCSVGSYMLQQAIPGLCTALLNLTAPLYISKTYPTGLTNCYFVLTCTAAIQLDFIYQKHWRQTCGTWTWKLISSMSLKRLTTGGLLCSRPGVCSADEVNMVQCAAVRRLAGDFYRARAGPQGPFL